jgi:hypothetical protein
VRATTGVSSAATPTAMHVAPAADLDLVPTVVVLTRLPAN